MAWGSLMPSNTEQGRNRTHLASVLWRWVGPLALLVLFHAKPASAASPAVVSIAAPAENAAVDAGVSTEVELRMCDLTDASLAVAPGSCLAAIPDAVTPDAALPDAPTPDVGARPVPEEAARAPGDRAAPMCDPNAMSIVAPVEIPEVDRGHFEPLPCDGQALLSLLRSQPRGGNVRLVAVREPPPRGPLQSPSLNEGNDGAAALSVPLYWPERAAPSTLAPHWHGGLTRQPGHRSRIERPPSLRA
jgi:hypothetical protein